jgi:cysteinyl-tRNA synthetase
MTLKLYNTRTRRKEVFEPLDPKAVRMYVCGPTVYEFAHIGNARPVIVFDVLFRLLRHVYGPEHVTYVRNITDVDDKINARAAEEGVSIRELTERTAAQFHADVAALGALPPTVEPRATEHIPEMIAMIQRLIERGHAYAAERHVLFNVPSDPHYGELARRSTDEIRAGARVEIAPYKRDPMDFVLWKPSAGSEPGWESPWGYGRPGWHLECSAMSEKHLGDIFDIHGGGIDLLFPHHENEVAQSTCAHGAEIMANFWMHNGHLQVEGQKMSKSLGNFVTIHDLLTNWHGFGWPGEALRFNMLRTHYRQPLDWTYEGLDEAHKTLWDWYGAIETVTPAPEAPAEALNALGDDLNTPEMIAEFHKLFREKRFSELLAGLRLIGLSGKRENLTRKAPLEGRTEIRSSGGASIRAQPSGTAIQRLVADRLSARKARNWAEADRIRDELSAMGISLKDAKNPVTGEIETTWEIAR